MNKKSIEILARLKSMANPENVEGMARFGINPDKTLGISIPNLRKIAREIGRDHDTAAKLWASGIHEARILAAFVDVPNLVTEEQMDAWAEEFDSWDVCDQVCANLFDRTPFAYQKAADWSVRSEEFVKRAGFALMASLAWHDKKATDHSFIQFFPFILQEAADDRNFVKKAVNWALRQIGKRNKNLNSKAIEIAEKLVTYPSKSAQWVGRDALRELTGEKLQARLNK